MRVRDLETLSEDRARLILHEQEAAMRLITSNLLHDVKVVYGREKVAEGEDSDGFLGQWSGGIAELIDFRACRTVKYPRN
jgi:hypothetical protein